MLKGYTGVMQQVIDSQVSVLSAEAAQALLSCLEQQAPLYEETLSQLLAKKVALLSNNLTTLSAADTQLKTIRKKLLPLEKQRISWLQQYWLTLNLPADVTPHTDALMAAFPVELQKPLRTVQLRLRRALQQIVPLQTELTQLLSLSLRWVDQNLTWMRQQMATPTGGAYEVQGFTSKPTIPSTSKPTIERKI
jgi:hypothetical protein